MSTIEQFFNISDVSFYQADSLHLPAMDVAIQRQLGERTLEELIQIAIHLIFEIQYRLELQEESESDSSVCVASDSDDDL